jgi:putative transposase
MSGALAYRPDRSQAMFVFGIQEGAYNTASLIEFLADLRDHLDGRKVTLIWDGLPAHRSAAMKEWLATQRRWPTCATCPRCLTTPTLGACSTSPSRSGC